MKMKILLALSLIMITSFVAFHNPGHGAILAMPFFGWFTNLFNGIGEQFRELMKKAKPFLKKKIPVAVGIINVLKMAVENPAVDFFTKLSQTPLDDMLVAKGREFLPGLVIKLKILEIASASTDNSTIIKALVDFLASLDPKARYGYYKMLADYLADALVDSHLDWREITHLTQIGHDEKVDGVELAAA